MLSTVPKAILIFTTGEHEKNLVNRRLPVFLLAL